MQMDYQAKGPERKEMAKIIAETIGGEVKYSGVPKCEYYIGPYTVTKEGALTWDEGVETSEVLKVLEQKGWTANAIDKFSISIPRTILDDAALGRLKSLIEAKGTLMKHAFKTEELEIEVDDEKVTFPWFDLEGNSDSANAYMLFIQALCQIAANQKRVVGKEKEVENEKYAFRCFLLKLGFIGNEYKAARKVLLQNLTGSSAFRTVKEVATDELSK